MTLDDFMPEADIAPYLGVSATTLQKLQLHALFPKRDEDWGRFLKADIDNFKIQTHDTDLEWLANSIEPDRPRPIRRSTSTLHAADLSHDDTIDRPDSWLSHEADLNDEDMHDAATAWLAANEHKE